MPPPENRFQWNKNFAGNLLIKRQSDFAGLWRLATPHVVKRRVRIYQMPGNKRYLILCMYSRYPFKSLSSIFSSWPILAIRIGMINTDGINAQ